MKNSNILFLTVILMVIVFIVFPPSEAMRGASAIIIALFVVGGNIVDAIEKKK